MLARAAFHNLLQAERCGGMLAGAEAQAGIQLYDHLPLPWPDTAPGRFDYEQRPYRQGFEMPLPGFSPIFPAHPGQRDPGGTRIQTARAEPPELFLQVRSPATGARRLFREIDGDHGATGLKVGVRRRRLAKGICQQCRDRVLSLG